MESQREILVDALKRELERCTILAHSKLMPRQWREDYVKKSESLTDLISRSKSL